MVGNHSQYHAEEEGRQELGNKENRTSSNMGSENERVRHEWKKATRSKSQYTKNV